MPPTHVKKYPIKYSIALVADVDSSTMGKNFSKITPDSLQDIKAHCESSFVNDAPNLNGLRKITRGTDSKFSGQMEIEDGVIALPAQVRDAIDAALTAYRSEIGTNLTFKNWIPPTSIVAIEPPPDLRCFRLVYEDGEWKVVYNALLENKKVGGTPDPKYPTPLSGVSLKDDKGNKVILKSDWIATFSYTI